MKQLAVVLGLAIALAIGPFAVFFGSVAQAQGAAHDETGALTAGPVEVPKTPLEKRFAGTYAEFSTFVGSGTFYSGGYHDPYVSNALYLKPVYHLNTKHDLTLNARFYVEVEYTQPDNLVGRRFYPLDPWFWLAARNLYTEPRTHIRFSGQVRAVLPLSYESRYQHLLTGLGVGSAATRESEFGRPDAKGKRWGLALSLGVVASKSFNTSVLRGNGPGQSTGCLSAPAATTQTSAAEPGVADSDRCGGPLNTSFSLMTAGGVTLTRSRWTAAVTLLLVNNFRYTAPADAFSSTDTPLGREDVTWGIISVGYEVRPHLGVGVGVSSQQPALDARYRYPRFPFFDFTGTNGNNYSQVFANVNGSI